VSSSLHVYVLILLFYVGEPEYEGGTRRFDQNSNYDHRFQ